MAQTPASATVRTALLKALKIAPALEAAPHLTCIDATPAELRIIARDYWNNGIRHIVALRGDLPPGSGKPEMYASDTVTLLKRSGRFRYLRGGVSGSTSRSEKCPCRFTQPETKSGCRSQPRHYSVLFDVESYLRFRDRCVSAGIDVEIIPGILPVSNFKQAKKFADMTNVRIPAWMAQMFDGTDDDAETRKLVGANIAMDMVKILSREGVKDFHFYTLNRAEMSYAICHTLGVRLVYK